MTNPSRGMNEDTLIFGSNTIKIYNKGYITKNNDFYEFIIDLQSIVFIGDYITYCKDTYMLVVHKFNEWRYWPGLFRGNKRIMLIYDNDLYFYNCSHNLGNFQKICANSGDMSIVNTTFSCKGTDNIDDFRRVIIRYLKNNNKEYDPRLMKYPMALFPETPKVVPLDYTSKRSYKLFDIIIRFIV